MNIVKPVFIIGFSRTGSTLLQHLLNTYTNIGIFPELHIYWPGWLHKDLVSNIKRHIGDISDDKIDQLIDLMYSRKLKGTFWKLIDKADIDQSVLKENIIRSDRTAKGIFEALMKTAKKSYKKETMGAKFPVHFSYAYKLLEWYPDCKIIHTIRDPRAIFASQFNKHKKKKCSRTKKLLTGLIQFVHVSISFNWVVRTHEKMKDYNNYYLLNYENLILQPETTLRDLCTFLEIEFKDEMLTPKVFMNTSYGKKRVSDGFHNTSVDSWKQRIPQFIGDLIKLVNGRSMKIVGYS